MNPNRVGPLIRQSRTRAGRSQLDVALDVEVSARHLSFVELGKSRPSPELIVLIANRLGASRREANQWLLAAGFAPHFPEHPLDSRALASVRRSVQRLLDAHEPYPAIALDRHWTVQLTNDGALRLVDRIEGDECRGTPTSVFRISLHPDGFASRTENFPAWSRYLLRELHRATVRTRDPHLIELATEIAGWPNIAPRATWDRPELHIGDGVLVPWVLDHRNHRLSMFTTMSTFGTPLDVTLSELTIELFLPADETTRQAFAEHLSSERAAMGAAL